MHRASPPARRARRSRAAGSQIRQVFPAWCRGALPYSTRRTYLVEKILVAAGFGAATRAHATHVILELFLPLPNVALVLDDRVERLSYQFLIEAVHVEQRQRLDPIERLADARR